MSQPILARNKAMLERHLRSHFGRMDIGLSADYRDEDGYDDPESRAVDITSAMLAEARRGCWKATVATSKRPSFK